jgi:hypothetical protein
MHTHSHSHRHTVTTELLVEKLKAYLSSDMLVTPPVIMIKITATVT